MQPTPKIGDKDFEAMRPDKTKIPQMTQRQIEIANFYVAVKMIDCFQFRSWMNNPDVIGPNGERINNLGEIYIPKFQRRR